MSCPFHEHSYTTEFSRACYTVKQCCPTQFFNSCLLLHLHNGIHPTNMAIKGLCSFWQPCRVLRLPLNCAIKFFWCLMLPFFNRSNLWHWVAAHLTWQQSFFFSNQDKPKSQHKDGYPSLECKDQSSNWNSTTREEGVDTYRQWKWGNGIHNYYWCFASSWSKCCCSFCGGRASNQGVEECQHNSRRPHYWMRLSRIWPCCASCMLLNFINASMNISWILIRVDNLIMTWVAEEQWIYLSVLFFIVLSHI